MRVCLPAEGATNVSWPRPCPLRGWVVWLWHLLTNLYVWFTMSSCYGSVNLYVYLTMSSCYDLITLALGLIRRDGGLRTPCHSCGFACQQRVLKTFPDPGYLRSEDGVLWLWHLLVNLYIWLYIYIYIYIHINKMEIK